MGKKFDEFVKKMDEESKKKTREFNPMERIDFFRKYVDSLYSEIDVWLAGELQTGKIQTGVVPITIMEERLGAYQVNEKWIQIGTAKIIFRPVGTILIGTSARVDMIYKTKDVMIVLVGEYVDSPGDLISVQIEGEPVRKKKVAGNPVWKYVRAKKRLSYVTLNKESFENLIMELVVVNGTR